MIEDRFLQLIAEELSIPVGKVAKATQLLNEGATIPFITRYRKDVTGGLDEVQLEAVGERNLYFTALTDRRNAVLEMLAKQNKLTDELRQAILDCTEKTTLEDLYLPYKKKQRSRATVAREKGLTPLADFLWEQVAGEQSIEEFAATFARPEKAVASVEEAIDGAHHILAERFALDKDVRVAVRECMNKTGKIAAHPTKYAEGQKTKYEMYYGFSEPVQTIPSHRFLAIHRGVKDGVLRMELTIDDAEMVDRLFRGVLKEPGSVFEPYIRKVVEDAYGRLIRPSAENEVVGVVRFRADEEAIRVFRENAENLLLAPPAGAIMVLGIDPGLRTGCKLAVVDKTGTCVENAVVFPNPPQEDVENAEKVLLALMAKHDVQAVAIGNGTGSRETARFAKAALAKIPSQDVFSVFVNEAGASIYSTSKIAREEFPDLDATLRSTIAIARRLQDPLAELVKVEPRHIGVGQYQHDVNQKRLREGLHRTVVSCVNRVGVDLNTASEALLRYVSGIQSNVAQNLVTRREELEGFTSRVQLLEVDGIGPKVFEQCVGFMRIMNADNVLDGTGIHPEAYSIVNQIATVLAVTPAELVENAEALRDLDLSQFETEIVGPMTLADVRSELLRPGRDPRTEFRVPAFLDGVDSVADLEEGMESEGVVTNVTDFGAFVDIGVHQDGLVHLSEMAHRFVQDPKQIVHVGEIVKVKVLKVDKELPRISLSIKALQSPPPPPQRRSRPRKPQENAQGTVEERPDRGRQQSRDAERSGASSRRDGAQSSRRQDGPDRPRRPERSRTRSPKRSKPSRSADVRQPAGSRQGDSSGPLNTQLADQLAALKDKFKS